MAEKNSNLRNSNLHAIHLPEEVLLVSSFSYFDQGSFYVLYRARHLWGSLENLSRGTARALVPFASVQILVPAVWLPNPWLFEAAKECLFVDWKG